MSFAITQNCCKDASCVAACPVNCIHPVPGADGFAAAPMLYIDPRVCIDCGACADACPVDAAVPIDTLRGPEQAYVAINARHYAGTPAPAVDPKAAPLFRPWDRPAFDWSLPSDFAGLDVAVVGTGPAGMYAAEMLLLHTASRVTLIDRLPVAGGLVRYGVAPDHPATKRIGHTFARLYGHPRAQLALGIEIGSEIDVPTLAECFDAVIYAVGASVGRELDVPGADLPGVVGAPRFVGWYNAHPDVAADAVRLDGERAIVVGTGNVALDVARLLTSDPVTLRRTDIADHTLAALRDGSLREVVLLGRRGPEHAAYTEPELRALSYLPDVEVVVDVADPRVEAAIDSASGAGGLLTGLRRARLDLAAAPEPGRRIVLRFHSTVAEVLGESHVEGVRLTDGAVVAGGLLVPSIGYRGHGVEGLPFDAATGVIPNEAGRIDAVPGAYAVGWAKRGSSGGIGDNRADAEQSVRTLLADAVAGRLPERRRDPAAFLRAARRVQPDLVDGRGLRRVLDAERARGRADGRTAVKFATAEQLRQASRGRRRLLR